MCNLHLQVAHMEVMRFSHSRARGSKVRFRSRGKTRLPGCMEVGENFWSQTVECSVVASINNSTKVRMLSI